MNAHHSSARRIWAVLAALGVAGGALGTSASAGASARAESVAPEPVYGGHLTMSGEAEVANPWTPAAMLCDSYCYLRARSFFDQVAVLDEEGNVVGWLAESIEPNDDSTEWTITIRRDIEFTDGTPLDAAAVITNLQSAGTGLVVSKALKDVARVPDPDNPDATILKIEQVDDFSFTIFLGKDGDPDQPLSWPTFPTSLTTQWGLIASPAWLEAVATDPGLASQPVGSGPFIVDRYAPRESLELSRNPDYWATDADGNQLPYLDSLSFRVIEDSEVGFDALQSGDIDLMSTSNSASINNATEMGTEIGVSLQADYTETYYLMMDLAKPPFDDQRVRCALSMSINREEIVDATGATGVATPANGLFSPGQQGHLDDNGAVVVQDIEGAKALIDDYEAETGNDVKISLGHTPPGSVVTTAELLQGYWSEIGVDAELDTIPQGDLITLAALGDPRFQVFIWRNHAGVYVDQQFYWWHSSTAAPDGELAINMARINDPEVDAALEQARSAASFDDGLAAAETVNKRFAEQCYNIPMSWLPWAILSRNGVGGVGTLTTPEGASVLETAGNTFTQTLYLTEE